MKKLISLVILSLVFEGYLNACTVSGEGCSDPEEGKLCVRVGQTCEEKKLCTIATGETCADTQAEDVSKKCVEIEINESTNCVEEDKKCKEITTGGTNSICSNAVSSGNNKKCILDGSKCVEVDKSSSSNYLNLSFSLLCLFFL